MFINLTAWPLHGKGTCDRKKPSSRIQVFTSGRKAVLLRLLLFGVPQALQECLFKYIKLLHGYLEQGSHMTNEDSGPGIVVSLKGNRTPKESVQVLTQETSAVVQTAKPKPGGKKKSRGKASLSGGSQQLPPSSASLSPDPSTPGHTSLCAYNTPSNGFGSHDALIPK